MRHEGQKVNSFPDSSNLFFLIHSHAQFHCPIAVVLVHIEAPLFLPHLNWRQTADLTSDWNFSNGEPEIDDVMRQEDTRCSVARHVPNCLTHNVVLWLRPNLVNTPVFNAQSKSKDSKKNDTNNDDQCGGEEPSNGSVSLDLMIIVQGPNIRYDEITLNNWESHSYT